MKVKQNQKEQKQKARQHMYMNPGSNFKILHIN